MLACKPGAHIRASKTIYSSSADQAGVWQNYGENGLLVRVGLWRLTIGARQRNVSSSSSASQKGQQTNMFTNASCVSSTRQRLSGEDRD